MKEQSTDSPLLRFIHNPWRWFVDYWRRSWGRKALVCFLLLTALCLCSMYGIARWYIWQEEKKPLVIGTSFIADYAWSLGLDAHQTMLAILDDLHVKHLRLVSYWNDIEPQKGQYSFSELDWEFAQANAHHAKVTLAIGLRQPRWPECHVPSWVDPTAPQSQWQPQLEQFIGTVVQRYKNNPALESYQLENEYYLDTFGICSNDKRERLTAEMDLVHAIDPKHTLIVSRSDNALGWPIHPQLPDQTGISIYRRVWTPILGRYIEYPFPSWYYAFLAGGEKIMTGRDTVIHELQTEPWPPHGTPFTQVSLAEQNKSFDAARFKDTVAFAKNTGMRPIDLWGAEYWYYRKEKLHDPSLWQVAQQAFQATR
ncbi:MAG TPA: beta-galactosidase [Candidatus Saccharimonadales bacterium]|nr:beta-galactosidase [Candidatus Saccharimonadales bacterium]